MNYVRDYTIVIGSNATVNERRAASFLQACIKLITGRKIPVISDSTDPTELEICIGKTNREDLYLINLERSSLGLWEFEIKTVGKCVFLCGLGLYDPTPTPFTSSYAKLNDGAYGTVIAVYKFVEDVLGYDFLYSSYKEFDENEDLLMPNDYSVTYTREELSKKSPKLHRGAAMWSVPGCHMLDGNMSCLIFRSSDGRLALLDGGRPQDAEHVIEILEAITYPEKPHISLWFFSHMHIDHYGLYREICKYPELSERIEVDAFLAHLLPEEFYSSVSREPNPSFVEMRKMIIESEGRICKKYIQVTEGEEYELGDLKFKVIHTPTMEFAEQMNMNDSSVVYRLDVGNQRILFLSDSEYVTSKDLMKNHLDEIKADVVQVGHHGCGNVSKECYEAIGANVYLWQTGNKFWYSECGEGLNTHNTGVIRTRAYMMECGARLQNVYRDTFGILDFALPIKIK